MTSQTLTAYPTALTVINRAAIQCTQAAVADPYAETNPDYILFGDLLVSLGKDLLNAVDPGWTHLIVEGNYTTIGTETDMALPADFRAMVDGSLWNRSVRLPGIGPLSPQQRAALRARLVSVVLNVTYMIQGNLMSFPIVPAAAQSIYYDYYSNYWVQSSGATAPDKDRPTVSTDKLLFDEELLVSGLVLRFLENRGYDTTKAQERYNSHLENAIGRNVGAPVVSLGGNPRNPFDRMIGGWQVPEGNWPT
jgi:hypothetical protein